MTKSILLVDDDREFVVEISEILTDAGYAITQAFNGEKALELFESYQPKLIILDMKLPKMTGIELIAIFKAKRPHTPIIMISGRPINSSLCKQDKVEHNLEEERLRLADQFINKPFLVEFLLESIENLIN